MHVAVVIALRPAFVSIRAWGRGYRRGAMVAGDAPAQVETVIAWSGGRRLHLLTLGEIGEGRRASVETPLPASPTWMTSNTPSCASSGTADSYVDQASADASYDES